MVYAVRRALQLVPALLAIVTLTFVIVHAAPGGPVVALSGEFSTAEYQRNIERLYGLDRPLIEQYLVYIARVLGGDLGNRISSSDLFWRSSLIDFRQRFC